MPEILGAALMGGGGKTDAFAAISVTYPEGATCTCSLDSEVLKAPDTSGSALFIVPTAGEWTVTISQSGEEPVSEIVNVNESKAYTVGLDFGLYYFNYGPIDGYTWAASNMPNIIASNQLGKAPTVTTQEDGSVSLFIAGNGDYLGTSGCYLLRNVDLNLISTLEINVEKSTNTVTTGLSVIPTYADAWGTDRDWGGDSLAYVDLNNGTSTLNVLNLNGTYNIAVAIRVGKTNSGSFIFKYLKAIEQG